MRQGSSTVIVGVLVAFQAIILFLVVERLSAPTRAFAPVSEAVSNVRDETQVEKKPVNGFPGYWVT